jgi:hypothetical protein
MHRSPNSISESKTLTPYITPYTCMWDGKGLANKLIIMLHELKTHVLGDRIRWGVLAQVANKLQDTCMARDGVNDGETWQFI